MTAARAVQLAWTPLSRRLGVTRTAQQRKQILAALAAMNWSADIDRAVTGIRGEAARTIAAAIRRCDRLGLLGIASLPGGHQLVGIEHADGTRAYLLDLDAEAIHVLAEVPAPDHRVA